MKVLPNVNKNQFKYTLCGVFWQVVFVVEKKWRLLEK
jgi:hypothetical protein